MRILPFGVKFAFLLKRLLGSGHRKSCLPQAAIKKWLEKQSADTCVLGHFHVGGEVNLGGKKAIVLPMPAECARIADGGCA